MGCNTSGGASAPKFASYKTETTQEAFTTAYTTLEKAAAYNKEDLLGSFEMKAAIYSKEEKTSKIAHSGKKFVNSEEYSGKMAAKYDKDHSLILQEVETTAKNVQEDYSYSYGRTQSESAESDYETNTMYQVKDGVVIRACKDTETYAEVTNVTDDTKAKYFDAMAKAFASNYSFSVAAEYFEVDDEKLANSKFYLDNDNLFTFVYSVETKDVDSTAGYLQSTSETRKAQVKVTDNEFTFKYEKVTTEKNVYTEQAGLYFAGDEVEAKAVDYMELSFKYKNVSLKAFDISKYVCYSKLS